MTGLNDSRICVLALDSDALMQHTVSMYIRTNQPPDAARPGVLSRQPRQRPGPTSHSTRPRKLLLRLLPPAERLTSRVCLEQQQQQHSSSRPPTPASSVQRASASCQAPPASAHPESYHQLRLRRLRPSSDPTASRSFAGRSNSETSLPTESSSRGVRRIPGPAEPGHASEQTSDSGAESAWRIFHVRVTVTAECGP